MKDLLTEARVMLGEDREHILEESFKIAVEKFGEDSKPTIDLFRKLVNKNQFQGQEKDINYWIKQGFEKFKSKVMEVEQKGSKKKQKKETNSTPHKDAVRVKDTENYEVFQIKSYEASKFMGRFYKNTSTKWCISTDNAKFFNSAYKDSSFYFFIRKEFKGDLLDKVALQLDEYDNEIYWDVRDNLDGDGKQYTPDISKEITDYNARHFERNISVADYTYATYELVNGVYNVDGDVTIKSKQLTKLPFKFGKVKGHFYCSGVGLTSLEGCPTEVGGDFECSRNKITSLKGCPQKVDGRFFCNNNNLTSLEGCPQKIDGDFDCSRNDLTSLKGSPMKVGIAFEVGENIKLTEKDFEFVKANCDIGWKLITD